MKEKKDYVFTTKNGRAELRFLVKGVDGLMHSASCEYPQVERVFNEQTQEYELKKLTRKQTEKYLLSVLGFNA